MSLPNPRIAEELLRYVNGEQRKRMLDHKYIESQKSGYDLGETAIFGWVDKYAASFRDWAESIPYKCFECGRCGVGMDGKECPYPYDPERLRLWEEYCERVESEI